MHRLIRTAVALATCALLLGQPGPAQARAGDTFLFGVNLPWLNWPNDFGGGSQGGGVSGNPGELDAKLQAAHTAGMRIVRWWVFEGGSPHIQRAADGTPSGLDSNVYTDLDAALSAAAKYDIAYTFVLFGGTNDDPTSHTWWENAAQRHALVSVLTPLLQRYGASPQIHAWEIVNEPEWQSRNNQTSVGGLLATADALAEAIHANTRALVTVGNAQVQDMQTWVGHPLDYYSPHYYDNFGPGRNDPFVTPAAQVSPDGKPVVIGEFPASAGLDPDAQTRWQALYANGYAGGWNWSLSPEHTGDKIATDLAAAAAFARDKDALGLGSGTANPTPPRAIPPPGVPPAQPTQSDTPASGTPSFGLGFASLRDALGPDILGTPTENEHGTPTGCDTQQLTTTGLAYWRCGTNTPAFAAFPDGLHHWALSDGHTVEWIGPSADPPSD